MDDGFGEQHFFDLRTPREFYSLVKGKLMQAHPNAAGCMYQSTCGGDQQPTESHSFSWQDSVTREGGVVRASSRVELMLKVRRMVEGALALAESASIVSSRSKTKGRA